VPVPEGTDAPPFPGATRKLLDAIGEVIYTELCITPAADQRASVQGLVDQAKSILQRYNENPFAGRPGTTLPRLLPQLQPGRTFGVPLIERKDAALPSIKQLLKQGLGPLGYRYKASLSGQGGYTLQKHGPQNYILQFFADASPIVGELCSSLSVHTLYAAFNVGIQLPPYGRNYPINEHLHDLIANVAFVVSLLEETFVREIQALFGPAPKWFSTWKLKGS
jgi:hypothetical protein